MRILGYTSNRKYDRAIKLLQSLEDRIMEILKDKDEFDEFTVLDFSFDEQGCRVTLSIQNEFNCWIDSLYIKREEYLDV